MTIPVHPIILTDVDLRIAEHQFEAHVSKVEMTPTTGNVAWKGMTPTSVHNFGIATVWVCGLDFAQDWATPESLSNYLYDHEGETVDVVFAPKKGGAEWGGRIVIAPGAIGGQGDAVATSSVTLGMSGRPNRITTDPTPGA